MTVEEFLENSAYGWESAGKLPQLQEAYADAEKMDPKSWVNKWAPVIMETPELTADFYDSKLLNTTKSLDERLFQTFGSSDRENPYRKSDKWLNQLYHSEFSDVPREQFDQAIKVKADYWDEFKKQREADAARFKREKEVKEDWTPFTKNPDVSTWTGLGRWLLGSEYEKQRYINEPEAAILGEQAHTTTENILNKGDAISDLTFGAAGAVGDMIPYGGIVLGPLARGARDVYHKVTDSPYQKEWGDIGMDLGQDVALNAFTDILPNFRQYTRALNFGTRLPAVKNISAAMQLEDDIKAILNPDATALATRIDASAGFVPVYVNGKPTGTRPPMPKNTEIKKIVEGMPDSPMKQELLPLVADPQSIDTDVITRTIQRWQSNAGRFYQSPAEKAAIKQDVEDPASRIFFPGLTSKDPLFSRIYLSEPLSGPEKAAKGALRGAETFLKSTPGSAAIKGGATGKGRGSKPSVDPQLDIEKTKNNLTRFFIAGFKPTEKEGDPKWEAYRQWYFEKYGEYPQEGTGKETWEFQFPEVNIRK